MSNSLRKYKRTKLLIGFKEVLKCKIKLEKDGFNPYLVLPNEDYKNVSLDKCIIIESMVKDIEQADIKSAFIHLHTLKISA